GAYPTEQVFKNPYTTVTAEDDYTKWRYEYYLNECHEMDTFIGDLINEINEAEEPTVMIIYGDHIPALDVKEENYKADDLYQTRYVIWDNIGLEKKDRNIHSYQSGAILLDDAGLSHEGVIFDYQQTTKPKKKSYLSDQEALAYDMLYGKNYAFGGEEPFETVDMKMGHKNISIKEIVNIGDRYYIRGKNFTERSIISLVGKQLATVYMSPTLLALSEKIDAEDVSRLEVSQVDKSEDEILTTVGANEEL
ncbi:MAG: sulfatase-like hydrolase/transferase, partial [Firmicutes bacterium]|nr:sulfatase-like hydrolase/transferase [Bacillota bacterium]